MVNKTATANRMLHKVAKPSMKIKKIKEENQVNKLLCDLKSILPASSISSQNSENSPEVGVIENAVRHINHLKSQLSREEIMMLDQMFSLPFSGEFIPAGNENQTAVS